MAVRWVWRAESGAGKIEYGALIVLVAVILGALVAAGLPTDVRAPVAGAVCELFGQSDCEPGEQGGGPGGDGSPGTGPSSSAEPGDDGEGAEGEGGDDAEGGDDGVDSIFNDPSVDPDVRGAEEELAGLEDDLADAEADSSVEDELLDLLADLIGWTDAKACLTEGDIMGCITTALSLIGPLKLLKVGTKIPKMWKLYNRWNKARKRLADLRDKVGLAKGKRDRLLRQCEANSFLPSTLVLMADGGYTEISDIGVGDTVLAGDPRTGATSAHSVSRVITGSGRKDLVDIGIGPAAETGSPVMGAAVPGGSAGAASVSAGGADLTATAGHPFWVRATRSWTPAADLRPGDLLARTGGGSARVEWVRERTREARVLNLTVPGPSTYFVAAGAADVLVHNAGPGCGDIWMDPKKIEHHYKHAEDFGVTGGFNKAKRQEFTEALGKFMRSPNNLKIKGTYRKNTNVIHYVDPDTGQHVSVAADGPNVGQVVAAWKSDPVADADQLRYLIEDGVL